MTRILSHKNPNSCFIRVLFFVDRLLFAPHPSSAIRMWIITGNKWTTDNDNDGSTLNKQTQMAATATRTHTHQRQHGVMELWKYLSNKNRVMRMNSLFLSRPSDESRGGVVAPAKWTNFYANVFVCCCTLSRTWFFSVTYFFSSPVCRSLSRSPSLVVVFISDNKCAHLKRTNYHK